MHDFSHLKDKGDVEEEVLIVDFDTLAVITGTISNVSEWGCRLTSPDAKELYKSIGIRPKDAARLVKAQVTSVKGNDAAVIFAKAEKAGAEKRREKRNPVNISVKIADLEGITEIKGTVVDAGNNGCKIMAQGLTSMPDEVVLTMKNFNKPVIAEFAWRNESSAGMRLLWNRTLEEAEKAGGDNEVEEEAQDA